MAVVAKASCGKTGSSTLRRSWAYNPAQMFLSVSGHTVGIRAWVYRPALFPQQGRKPIMWPHSPEGIDMHRAHCMSPFICQYTSSVSSDLSPSHSAIRALWEKLLIVCARVQFACLRPGRNAGFHLFLELRYEGKALAPALPILSYQLRK